MKLFLKNLSIIPRWIIFFLDLCFASFAFFLAGVIRFNFDFQIYLSEIATASFLWYIGAYLLSMLIFRPFIGVVRYTHTRDIFTVMKVAAFASALLICLNIVNLSFPLVHTVPYGIIVVAAMFTSTFLIGYRFVVKEFFDFAKRSIKKKRKTVIYGAGMAGRTTADVLESNDTEYEVLFFLDDNEKISNNRLYGKKIVFPGKSLRETL
ncbi:MAG: FlaA1/EpsC-like NDP-sugar epimerase, partial [Parvicella sp.]